MGVGRLLWEARLCYIGNRNLSIAAVQARVEFNKKQGFTYLSYQIRVYCGVPDKAKLVPVSHESCHLVEYMMDNYPELSAYDNTIHTKPRETFIKQWVNPDTTRTLLAKNPQGEMIGYGCSQPNFQGSYHIGPIYADDPQVALVLFNNLASKIPEGAEVGVDVLQDSTTFNQLMKTHHFTYVLDLVRMYNKCAIELPLDKVHCISTCGISLI